MEELFPGIFLVEAEDVGGGWRALSWFADTPEGGLLIDPPAFGPSTAMALDRLGGAKHIFVTHALAVRGACKFKQRYRASLVAHRALLPAFQACQVDTPFDRDFSLFQGARAVCSGVHSSGSSFLYLMRDRGFLFAGDLLAVAGGRGPPALQLREGGEPAARRRALERLRSLRFGAVLPYYTRHEAANHVAGPHEAVVEALLAGGAYVPR